MVAEAMLIKVWKLISRSKCQPIFSNDSFEMLLARVKQYSVMVKWTHYMYNAFTVLITTAGPIYICTHCHDIVHHIKRVCAWPSNEKVTEEMGSLYFTRKAKRNPHKRRIDMPLTK